MEEQQSLLVELSELLVRHWRRAQPAHAETPHPSRLRKLFSWLIPNGGTLLIVAILLMTQSLWARPQFAPNAPGPSATTVNYQGRLADNAGIPLDGTYGMSFALYDAATDGALIWGPEAHTAVPVSEGLFSVGLGSQTSGGIPTTTWNGDRYLEITVGGETLSPRELIRSVPIAGMALTVLDRAITNQKLALSYWKLRPPDAVTITSTDPNVKDEVLNFQVDIPVDSMCLVFAKVVTSSSEANKQMLVGVSIGETGAGGIRNTHPISEGDGRETGTLVDIVECAAGIHTVKLEAYMETGTEGTVHSGSNVIVIPFGEP